MSLESPVAIIYDGAGNPLAVSDGVAIPASTTGLMPLGSDGTNARYLKVDSSGRLVVVGAGTAGTPAGGVLSIQGVSGGTVVPVSGTVTITDPAEGATGSAIPATAILIGGSDGTNLQAPRVFDADSGAGTQWVIGAILRKSGSGGSVEAGTSSDPLRIDPTGTTTQPISAVSLPLPTGAATETTLAARLADTTFTTRINTQGQKTMSASTPVVIASDQSVIPISQLSTTGTTSQVSSSATNVTLLASNASRKGATIYNDSTKLLYVKYGATATTSNFSALMRQGDYLEIPYGYQGIIDGIWSSVNGSARITELT